jgi:hypothetical protein
MVTNPWEVLDPTTPDQHHRVLLKVVAHSWNIGGYFNTIG